MEKKLLIRNKVVRKRLFVNFIILTVEASSKNDFKLDKIPSKFNQGHF